MSTIPYVVRQGEHLQGIAASLGLDAAGTWADARNAELRSVRASPNILLPGDLLYLPVVERKWLKVSLGGTNVFTASVGRCTITHVFLIDGKPLAGKRYRVATGAPVGAEPSAPPMTDGDGTATFDVRVDAEEVVVVFESGHAYTLHVGHLDPVNTPSGCDQRLVHLGFLSAMSDQSDDDDDHEERSFWRAVALRSFQQANDLTPSGLLDDATSNKLSEVFGC